MAAPRKPDQPPGPPSIHAPWRLEYLEAVTSIEKQGEAAGSGNFLHDFWLDPASDERNLVIHRDGHGFIVLNRYPYANGHLLVALGEPRPTLLDYSPEQRAALWLLVDRGVDLMQRTLEPQGINIGINQGRAAGAGVPQHLHVHLVPRWGGDVNFMSVVGQVRVIPAALPAMWERYRRAASGR
ncbi:MAG: HIT domain-containing protein [Phycisphaerales bacterium]|nr:HIT domain-containing protein [Phycisphaerales bacterium]